MDYNALKVADLKGLLKERGIASTGLSRKQQIIDALVSHDDGEGGGNGREEAAGGEASEEGVIEEQQAEAHADDGQAGENGEGQGGSAIPVQDAGEGNVVDPEGTIDPIIPTEETADSTTQPLPTSELPPTEPLATDGLSTQPTILESNQPVSREPSALTTPSQPSPVGESSLSDRKRKRRSPTPPVDEETVNKKLKAADDDNAVLPEIDGLGRDLAGDAAAPMPAAGSQYAKEGTGVEMNLDNANTSHSDAAAQVQTYGATDPPEGAEHSVHSSTRAIYIANLVRPIQPGQLSDYLHELAADSNEEYAQETFDIFHLGTIRTHAFAVFNSISRATKVRNSLHGRVWPDEPARKALWVDFVPENRVPEWIDRETEGIGRRDARRWEVVYDLTPDGVVARHEEVGATIAGGPDRRPSNISTSGQGMGMPNAPLGPRSSRPSIPTPSLPPPKQSNPNLTSSASFVVLDERFPSTTAKPKLYYLPVSKDIAERRLDELDRQTSREWGARGGEMVAGGGVGGGVRRYTFEDQDRLVDGGPHYDDFSGPRGGGAGGGRRRGGGGGGFRGRR